MNNTHLVFVYGTLKQGHRYHYVMQNARPELIGSARSKDAAFDIIMHHSVNYPRQYTPGAILTSLDDMEQGFHIEGELYRVDDQGLAVLDELEEVGIDYNRDRYDFHINGDIVSAWMYTKICIDGHVQPTAPYVTHDKDQRHVKWCIVP